MKKNLLSIAAVLIAVLLVAFTQQPEKATFTERYFQYAEDDISFNNLKSSANWTPITLPATGCSEGEIPCIVKVEGLSDYGGSYSPGVVDHVDFARFLELQGAASAQDYVTGDNMEEGKE